MVGEGELNEIEKGKMCDDRGAHKYCNCPAVGGGRWTLID